MESKGHQMNWFQSGKCSFYFWNLQFLSGALQWTTHFSGVWGPLWKQKKNCTLQFLKGVPLKPEYLLTTCFVAHYMS